MRARSRPEQALVFVPAAVALGMLLLHLARDVHGKPLIEDEAVSGLISARPLHELLATVLTDRGGAPLHFVLAHIVLAFDSSADALRWLSIVLAVGAVLVSFELGRRLGGPVAGATAAVAGATSGLLTIYGSVARMYALLALVGGVAAVLFVRALERRTAEAAFTAALAALLLPATHPYGGIAVAAEAVVALVVWRGRPLRPALPALAAGALALPFAFVDFRLGGRIELGEHGRAATPGAAWEQLELAVRGSAGGAGVALAAFLLLAGIGFVTLVRERPAVAALAALWLLAPPLLILAVRSGAKPDLSPRHLIYALPLWAAAAGVGAARLLVRARPIAQAGALALLTIVAILAPSGIRDPRSLTYAAPLGSRAALAEPARRLRAEIEPGDVLFPFSSVFLAALPEAGRARALPPGEPKLIARAARRVELPAGALFVAVPVGASGLHLGRLRQRLGPGFFAARLGSWLIVEARGPFDDRASILTAATHALDASQTAASGPLPEGLSAYYGHSLSVLREAKRTLSGH